MSDEKPESALAKWAPAAFAVLLGGGAGSTYGLVSGTQLQAEIADMRKRLDRHVESAGHPVATNRLDSQDKKIEALEINARADREAVSTKLDSIKENMAALCAAQPRAKCSR